MKSSLAILIVSLLASQAAAQIHIAPKELFQIELGGAEARAPERWQARANTEITVRAELAMGGKVAVLVEFGEPDPTRMGRGMLFMLNKLVHGGVAEKAAILPPFFEGYDMVLRGYALTGSGDLLATAPDLLHIQLEGVEHPD